MKCLCRVAVVLSFSACMLPHLNAVEVGFAPAEKIPLIEGHLKMGGVNPSGETLYANSRYFLLNGKPWIPVSGELHFSRLPAEAWPKALRQMRLGGINTVSTYIFWNHHEEQEGVWDWDGRRNLRNFIKAAEREDLKVFLRIGPWSHGEARNGGFPDWLMKKPFRLRSVNPGFMAAAREFYRQISLQAEGLFWKDGGPVIGLQFDNEMKWDAAYLLELKRLAVELGMVAPIYTVTGWSSNGGICMPEDEMIPVFGGYVDEPWAQTDAKLPPALTFFFSRNPNDCDIGSDLKTIVPKNGKAGRIRFERYPYATCEVGAGLQNTYRRRYIVHPMDAYVPCLVKLGSGNNMPGYYVYHGGLNPPARSGTLQESRANGEPNDLPIVDYDYQAPISAFGEEREQYGLLNMLHLFLEDFGEEFAPMSARDCLIAPSDRTDCVTIRAGLRSNGKSGFVFVNNYQRGAEMPVQRGVEFVADGVRFPTVDIPSGVAFFMPYNMRLGDRLLLYATAQPVARDGDTFVFLAIPGIAPRFKWEGSPAKVRIVTWEEARELRRIGGKLVRRPLWRGKTVAARLEPAARPPFEISKEAEAELRLGGESRVSWYRIHAEGDGFAEIAEVCDVAQIHVDGRLVADNFYSGTPWRVPVALFGGRDAYLALTGFRDAGYREFEVGSNPK